MRTVYQISMAFDSVTLFCWLWF